jgi:hypothetical protein
MCRYLYSACRPIHLDFWLFTYNWLSQFFLRLSWKLIAIRLAENFFFVELWISITFLINTRRLIIFGGSWILCTPITLPARNQYVGLIISTETYIVVGSISCPWKRNIKTQLLMIVLLDGGNRQLFNSCIIYYYLWLLSE